jgi:hypothetical protein
MSHTSVVFTASGDDFDRSGYLIGDEGPFGIIVNGWGDGINYRVPEVRLETDQQRHYREELGIHVEHARRL